MRENASNTPAIELDKRFAQDRIDEEDVVDTQQTSVSARKCAPIVVWADVVVLVEIGKL